MYHLFSILNMTDDIIINNNGTRIFRHHAESDDYDEDEFLIQQATCHKRFRLIQYNATFKSK